MIKLESIRENKASLDDSVAEFNKIIREFEAWSIIHWIIE